MEFEVGDPLEPASGALLRVDPRAPLLAGLDLHDQDRVAHYLERASSAATLRAYRAEWRILESWVQLQVGREARNILNRIAVRNMYT